MHRAKLSNRQVAVGLDGLSENAKATLRSLQKLPTAVCLLTAENNIVWSNAEFQLGHPQRSEAHLSRLTPWLGASLEGLRFMTPGYVLQADAAVEEETKALADEAHRDPLTKVWNRLHMEHLFSSWQRDPDTQSVSALLIDLDRFKHVNDTLGHDVGDALLISVTERLKSTIRETDHLIRLGGDEFLILQRNNRQPKGADLTAQRVVELLSRPFLCSGHQSNISASVGVATYPLNTTKMSDLVRHADLAMYKAKSEGKNRASTFQPALAEAAAIRRNLEINLRKALTQSQFELVYQPQVTLPDGVVTGFEALLRWNHPEEGLISPADFIPLAEELGEIVPIGAWVLNTACQQAMRWPGELTISVNVSPLQFKSSNFTATVENALAVSGLSPERLEIEITEGVLLENSARSVETLWQLRELGIGIAMDDFGTGYSSLSYLHSFPFSKLKIDQSFIRSAKNDRSSTLVSAMIGLGNSLSMKTIAEGVETLDQFDELAEGGCAQAQGYYIAKPMAAGAIDEFLATTKNEES